MAIRHSAPRRLTQEISRYVFEPTSERGGRAFDGIRYLSRLGDDLRNWALLEPVTHAQVKGPRGSLSASSTPPRGLPLFVGAPSVSRPRDDPMGGLPWMEHATMCDCIGAFAKELS